VVTAVARARAVEGGPPPLDREAVLALARERSALILAGRARRGVAAGELAAARQWRYNPELELAGGPRTTPTDETWDRSLWLGQRLDFAGRGDRIAAARYGHEAAVAEQTAAEIDLLADVARTHLGALHAVAQQAVTADAVALHERLDEVARLREAEGEVGILEVHTAAVALARVRAEHARRTAAVDLALAELAALLALDPAVPLAVAGDLAWPLPSDLAAVRAAADRHPVRTALAARRAEAESRRAVAAAARIPEFTLGAGIGREEDADLVTFGLGVSLPLFARGGGEAQAEGAEAAARAIELDAVARTQAGRIDRACRRHQQLQTALAAYEAEAVAVQARGVDLVELSYREGKLPLGEVLGVRREYLDARRELLDLRLETALAALDVAQLAALPPLAAAPEAATVPPTGAAVPAPGERP